jgi:hypothetical protein
MPAQADDHLRPQSRPRPSGPKPSWPPAACSLRAGTALDANMHRRHAGLKPRLAQKKREAADEQIFAQL